MGMGGEVEKNRSLKNVLKLTKSRTEGKKGEDDGTKVTESQKVFLGGGKCKKEA